MRYVTPVLLAIGAVLVLTHSAPPPPVAVQPADAPTDLTALQDALSELLRAQDTLTEDVDDLYQQLDAPAAEPLPPSPTPPDPEAQAERTRLHVIAQQETLEDAMAADRVDPAWRDQAEAELLTRFDEQGIAAGELVESRCAGSMCRIEVAFSDELNMDREVESVLGVTPWDGESFFSIEGGDSPHIVLYIARPGATLPRAM